MVNRERLAETFEALVKIDSVSRNERAVCDCISGIFQEMGAETITDRADKKVNGNTGNLVVRFNGGGNGDPLLIGAHMDTVTPGNNIKPVLEDGVFSSDGDTILGADDKSAVAIIIEAMRVLNESRVDTCPIELVFTVCEEIGLMGAKHLDYSLVSARYGYMLDASDPAGIVTRAPAANRFEFVVHGKDAHAGANPEDGVNAIAVAAKAIAKLEPGRVDAETTFNIGGIEGGMATNIVPPEVRVTGESRSQRDEALDAITDKIVSVFRETVDEAARQSRHEGVPWVDVNVEADFKSLFVPSDHPAVQTARKAAANLGVDLTEKVSGGGSDANILFQHGITTCILGTGMKDMHTVRETVALDDMVRATELLVEIVKCASA
ncbi:MAG: M20/M25/M40 family metallo-hydrolase [Thermodesulfobacteriota bacterium]|nr:M20/M25/M40 family metallo-hydrolase [Thermodesulfobacteriota bacterium]